MLESRYAARAHDYATAGSVVAFDYFRVGTAHFHFHRTGKLAIVSQRAIQLQALHFELIPIHLRDDVVRIAMHDQCRHAGVHGAIERVADQLDRITACATVHDAHGGRRGACFANATRPRRRAREPLAGRRPDN